MAAAKTTRSGAEVRTIAAELERLQELEGGND
jgi:hypothetical protein